MKTPDSELHVDSLCPKAGELKKKLATLKPGSPERIKLLEEIASAYCDTIIKSKRARRNR